MTDLERYKAKGLTDSEAEMALSCAWRFSPQQFTDAERLFVMNGYSCAMISNLFPGANLKELLRARAELDWDQKRANRLEEIENSARANLPYTRIRALSFLDDFMQGIETKYKSRIAAYLSNPERERMPDVAELNEYLETLKRVDEAMSTVKSKENKAAVANDIPVIQINVNQTSEPKQVGPAIMTVDVKAVANELAIASGRIKPE